MTLKQKIKYFFLGMCFVVVSNLITWSIISVFIVINRIDDFVRFGLMCLTGIPFFVMFHFKIKRYLREKRESNNKDLVE